jgi:hypothetical protein
VFAAEIAGERPPNIVMVVLVAVTFGLAFLTTRFIENPVRRRGQALPLTHRKPIVAGLAGALVVVMIAVIPGFAIDRTLATQSANGASSSKIGEDASAGTATLCIGAEALAKDAECQDGPYASLTPNPLAERGAISQLMKQGCGSVRDGDTFAVCTFGNPQSEIRVAYVGDSHAMTMFPAIEKIANENGWMVTTYLRYACGWRANDGKIAACDTYRENVSAALTTGEPWSAVILLHTSARDAEDPRAFTRVWQPVLNRQTQIIVIRDNPQMKGDPRQCVVDNLDNYSSCGQDRKNSVGIDPQYALAKETPGMAVIDLTDFYCNAAFCPAVVGGRIVYRDSNHVQEEYNITLAPYLEQKISEVAPRLIASVKSK